jgi:hypothetical protein
MSASARERLAGFRGDVLADIANSRDSWTAAEVAIVISTAYEVISELDAEVARLKAELEARAGINVLLCMERDFTDLATQAYGEPDGTVIRTTDTGQEWVKQGLAWNKVAP